MRLVHWATAAILGAAVLLVACGSDDSTPTTPTPTSVTVPTPGQTIIDIAGVDPIYVDGDPDKIVVFCDQWGNRVYYTPHFAGVNNGSGGSVAVVPNDCPG